MTVLRSPAPSDSRRALDIAALIGRAGEFRRRLDELKRNLSDVQFYPYPTLDNLGHLDALLQGDRRRLLELAGSHPIADIGAADGDLAFFLEWLGAEVHVIDNGPTNFNGLRGVRTLASALGSRVQVHEMDLDSQFKLPRNDYGLVIFLGILYHLKNPHYALETLARSARHVVLSTRVARFAPPAGGNPIGEGLFARFGRRLGLGGGLKPIADLPVAYLLGETECNNDSTNYWIFTSEGLKRLLHRCGWDVLDFITVGNRTFSDPATASGDERAFCIARSRVFANPEKPAA